MRKLKLRIGTTATICYRFRPETLNTVETVWAGWPALWSRQTRAGASPAFVAKGLVFFFVVCAYGGEGHVAAILHPLSAFGLQRHEPFSLSTSQPWHSRCRSVNHVSLRCVPV